MCFMLAHSCSPCLWALVAPLLPHRQQLHPSGDQCKSWCKTIVQRNERVSEKETVKIANGASKLAMDAGLPAVGQCIGLKTVDIQNSNDITNRPATPFAANCSTKKKIGAKNSIKNVTGMWPRSREHLNWPKHN